MDYFEPKTILIAVTLLVFLAIVLDFMRRKKRNRYENLQMSSRELERSSRGDIEEDPFVQSQFPSGPSRVVKVRDREELSRSEQSSTALKEPKTASLRKPEQGALFADSVLSDPDTRRKYDAHGPGLGEDGGEYEDDACEEDMLHPFIIVGFSFHPVTHS